MRRVGVLAIGMALVASACAVEGSTQVDASSSGEAVSTVAAPATTAPAPTTTLPPTTTTTLPPTTTTTVVEETVGGPGVDHDVFMAALEPLIVAELAMHDFEVDWDEGMTYSETFQGWRAVKAIYAEAIDSFAFPADASAEQLEVGQIYVDAVQGAHDEWQNVTDFIVTYITNYTPEVLILNAYSQAEFRLDDAIVARDALVAMGA